MKHGVQLANSRAQLDSVDLGASTRKGPEKPCDSLSHASREMDCKVFPRPISSARMDERSLTLLASSQDTPSAW